MAMGMQGLRSSSASGSASHRSVSRPPKIRGSACSNAQAVLRVWRSQPGLSTNCTFLVCTPPPWCPFSSFTATDHPTGPQIVTLVLQRQDRQFAEYIGHFLPAYTQYALLELDPKGMHLVRPKWRLLALAFLIRAAGDATYSNPGWITSRAVGEPLPP